jgi:hypothetical protein
MRHWATWINDTPLSMWLQSHLWVVPTSQSIHLVMISIVFGCAVVLNLRLLGVSSNGRSISTLVRVLVPWMYFALVMLLITGLLQTITEPDRQFITPAFWWKMTMIVVVVCITVWFARAVRGNAAKWDSIATRPHVARLLAVVSLALWIGIIYCGRFIGYTYQFHMSNG